MTYLSNAQAIAQFDVVIAALRERDAHIINSDTHDFNDYAFYISYERDETLARFHKRLTLADTYVNDAATRAHDTAMRCMCFNTLRARYYELVQLSSDYATHTCNATQETQAQRAYDSVLYEIACERLYDLLDTYKFDDIQYDYVQSVATDALKYALDAYNRAL